MAAWAEKLTEKFPSLGRYRPILVIAMVLEGLWTGWVNFVRPGLDAWSRADFFAQEVHPIVSIAKATLHALSSPIAAITVFFLGFGYLVLDTRIQKREKSAVYRRVSEITGDDSAEQTARTFTPVPLRADEQTAVDALVSVMKSHYIRRQIYEGQITPAQIAGTAPLPREWLPTMAADLMLDMRRKEISWQQSKLTRGVPQVEKKP